MKRNEQKPETRERIRFYPDEKQGLSDSQIQQRKGENLVNVDATIPTKSVGSIVRDNVCTLFNFVIALLGVAVLLVGEYKNLLFVAVMLINMLIGIVQEIRTKRTIDKLSLLSATGVKAIRNGIAKNIPVDEVVLDDVLEFSRGNQIVTDCIVLSGSCNVNESLITGESVSVHKKEGDTLLSGSFVVNGCCRAQVEHVGAENYVSRISNSAKTHKKGKSEIMRSINQIIKTVSIAIFPLGTILFINQLNIDNNSLKMAVTSTAGALVGMIPEGLVLLTTSVLAVSVIRLSKRRVMVQELYCIEALARVDVLCLDKTGTITEGRMELCEIIPLNKSKRKDIEALLNDFAAALQSDGPTIEAIYQKYHLQTTMTPDKIVPFSSEKKWSGASFGEKGSLILGAPEFVLQGELGPLKECVESYSKEGRVLLFSASPNGFDENEALPKEVTPLALLLLQDVVRPDAPDTLRYFAQQGVQLKVISGDNPVTVSMIAKRVGMEQAEKYVDASTLKSEEQIQAAVEEYTVFGRVSPVQKKQMVKALQAKGHTVAMTGDGVNDVLALKEADCSVAMASGSEAARNVSQLVLLASNFSAMPQVVMEGRRAINNLQRSASIFIVKTIYSICLSLILLFLPILYPFQPIQLTLLSSLTIGLPSFVLALEPNHDRIQGDFLKNIVSRAAPTACAIVLNVILVEILAPFIGLNGQEISTLCVLLTGIIGLLHIFKLCRPFTPIRTALFVFITAALAFCIVFFREMFSLSALTLPLLWIALPVMASAVLCFFLFQAFFARIFQFAARHKQKKKN